MHLSLASLALALPLATSATAALFAGVFPGDSASVPHSTTVGFIPRGLTSFGAVVDEGWLYVLGGYHGEPHAYSIEGQSRAFMAINLYDPRDQRLLDDVEPVQSVELVAVGDELVRIGGMHAENAADEASALRSSDVVRAYSTTTHTWRDLPALPEPRSSHRAIALGTWIHVVGGWTLSADGGKPRWAAESFSIDLAAPSPAWERHAVPFQRRAFALAPASGSALVAVGGLTPEGAQSSDTWILDADTMRWTEGPEFPEAGFGATATAFAGRVLASGGSGTVWSLTANGAWEAAGRLAHGRIFHELRAEAEGVIAVGGIVGMRTGGRVRAIERLDLTGETPAPCVEEFTIPTPAAARNRSGLVTVGRSVYLFGGNKSTAQHDFEPEHFSRESWRLDLSNHTWTRLADMPLARQSMRVNEAEGTGEIVLFGGFGHDGEAAVSQAAGLRYDLEFDEWRDGPVLTKPLTQFGLAQRGAETWLFGGLDYDPARPRSESFIHVREVLVADAEGVFAVSDVELPRARRAFAGAVLGDRYYLVGGMREGFATVDEVDVFDFAERAWSTVAAPARPRVGADTVVIDGALYLVGGTSPSAEGGGLAPNPSIECFDPETGTWTTLLEDVGVPMHHAQAFAVDGRICILDLQRGEGARITYVDVAGARERRADPR